MQLVLLAVRTNSDGHTRALIIVISKASKREVYCSRLHLFLNRLTQHRSRWFYFLKQYLEADATSRYIYLPFS